MAGYVLKNNVTPFENNFIVTKDMYGDNPSVFSDLGNDAFDTYGSFRMTNGSGSYPTYIPFTNKNGADGVLYSETFVHDSVEWKVIHGWVTSGIFIIQVSQISGATKAFRFYFNGGYGSDGGTQYGKVTTNYSGKYITTYWNNDGGKDVMGGDPQVTWTIIPYEQSRLTSSTVITTSSRSGDNETGYINTGISYGFTYILQVGHATVQSVQDWIVNNIELDYAKKFLIVDGTEVKNWSGSTYQKIGDMPLTQAMFDTYGMTTINPSRSGIVSVSPSVAMWTDDMSGVSYTLREIVVPKPKIILMNYDFNVPTGTKTFETIATVSGTSVIKLICSMDSGLTWKSWYSNTWATVDVNNITDVATKGMTPATFNGLSSTIIDLLGSTTKVRFGCYLKLEASTQTCQIDFLRVNFK